MSENRFKEQFMAIPIERHETAAWANMKETKPVSNVLVPTEEGVIEAKEYVDTNEK